MTPRRIAKAGAFYFGSILLLTTLCWAQTGTGKIQGTVKDASGAVVSNAKVTLIHAATNS